MLMAVYHMAFMLICCCLVTER